MDNLLHDLRFAFRQLGRARGVTAAAVACIALGVGANTTIFSAVSALLLRPVPGIADTEGLVEVGRMDRRGQSLDTFSYGNWRDLREHNDVLEEMGGWTFSPLAFSGEGEPEVVMGSAVTPGYFDALRLEPARGRFFTEEEAGPGVEPLVVIGHGLWQRRFGADPDILGRTVRVNGQPAVVVGVAPERFAGHLAAIEFEAWVPLGMRAPGLPVEDLESRRAHFLMSVGRLAPGVSISEATTALEATYGEIIAGQGLEQTVGLAPLAPLPAFVRGGVTLFMTVLMVVVGLVLMIACINVAGMLLARAAGRSREIAIRQALGAGRGRLVRQMLTESLVLFLMGGGAGVLLALWAIGVLGAFDPPTPPPFDISFELALDSRVLGFALALTLATGVIFGLWPALRASRPGLVSSLKDDVAGGTVRRSRVRSVLVGGQMAVTLLLLVAAGLFLRALGTARAVDIGFDPADVMTMSFDLQLHGYDEVTGRRFVHDLLDRLEADPAVESASLARLLPLGLPSRISYGGVNVPGVESPDGYSFDADLNMVSPGYFETLEMPLLAGRGFTRQDVEGSGRVAVINETMARRFWPEGGAVGEHFIVGSRDGGELHEIIGVAADSKYTTFQEQTPMFTYLTLDQQWSSDLSLQARGRGDPGALVAALRDAVRGIDPDLPVMEVTPLRDYVEIGLLPQRVAGIVAGIIGLCGLLLGAVGIYGVTAYAVSQRVHEVGVRLALGAGAREVLRMVVRQGMLAPAAGMAVGLVLAAAMTRFLGAFLFGISPLDPLTFGGVVGLLGAVSLLANLVPARRASRTDPMVALRGE